MCQPGSQANSGSLYTSQLRTIHTLTSVPGYCLRLLTTGVLVMQSSLPSCLCGRVFTTQSALTNHQHTCTKSKKRLSSTLDKAKLLLGSKRRRIEQEPSVSELPSDTSTIQPTPNQVIVNRSTAIIKSILLILLFAFRYLLIQQTKMNLWQQDGSVDRIASFLNDSEISFLRLN